MAIRTASDDADLKQMYAYILTVRATRSFLLYPRVDSRKDVVGFFEPPSHDLQLNHSCGMWFLDLFDGSKLRRELGTDILQKLASVNRANH